MDMMPIILVFILGGGVALLGKALFDKYRLIQTTFTPKSPPGNGNLVRIRILNNELTQKEFALLKADAKFRALFEHAPVMIGSFDSAGIPDLWNKECVRVFGYTQEEIIGNPNALSLFYGDDVDHVKENVKCATGEFNEYEPKTKTGRKVRCAWANMPLPDGSVISVGYELGPVKKAKAKASVKKSKKSTPKEHPKSRPVKTTKPN